MTGEARIRKPRSDRRDQCRREHGAANYIRRPGGPPRCRICIRLRAFRKRLAEASKPIRERPTTVPVWMTSAQARVYLYPAFWGRVALPVDPDGCWEWTGTRRDPYGRLRIRGKAWRTHRLARFVAFGDLPEAVCHHCDNPPCVNPEHLRAGTLSDNCVEMWAKGRQNVLTKVTPEQAARLARQVAHIQRSARMGQRRAAVEALAAANGISYRTLYRLVSAKEMPVYLRQRIAVVAA